MKLRPILQSLTVLLIFAALATPCMEWFDRWDTAAGLSSDTEIHVFCWILAISLIFATTVIFSRMFLYRMSVLTAVARLAVALGAPASCSLAFIYVQPVNCSPPLPLRI